MVKRRRKSKSIKSIASRGKIRRDKNGKFVNKSGTNSSKGYNKANLKKGQAAAKKRGEAAVKKKKASVAAKKKTFTPKKKASKSKSKSKGKATVAAIGSYLAARYTGKAMAEIDKGLTKAEKKAIKAAKVKIGTIRRGR